MHNQHSNNTHIARNQSKQVLAQTHRVIQCDINTGTDLCDQNSNQEQPPSKPLQTENNQRNFWQQLRQNLKKFFLPGLLTISVLLVPQTQARDVSVSVQGQIQPGLYGQIHVGPPAVTVYQQPVYVQPVYSQPVYVQPHTVYVQPVLVQAPKKHRKHWKKYCHHYGACQHRVQFVEVDYRPRQYEKVYVYQERDRGRHEEKRHYHDRRH